MASRRRSKPAARSKPRGAAPARKRRAVRKTAPRARKPVRRAKPAAARPKRAVRKASKKIAPPSRSRTKPVPGRTPKPRVAKSVGTTRTTRRTTRGVQTLPIPPARQKRRSAAPPRRRRAAAVTESVLERTVLDTTHERTAPAEPFAGALVVEPWSAEQFPTPVVAASEGDSEEISDDSAAESRRYVAVVSEVPGVEVFAEKQPSPGVPPATRRGRDRYATDIPIAIVSAALAGSTFLPWYKGPSGFGIHASGWASGSWGPIILFLAGASVVLITFRRLGVRVGLPVEESLIHEAAGWVSLVGAVLMSRLRPGGEGLLTADYGVWIAIAGAAGLIVLAGRMSPHAPLVVRPGWHKGKAGLIGIVVLGIIVAGSAVFGVTNNPKLQATGGSSDPLTGSVRGKIPDCAKEFPLPDGVKPQYGFGVGGTCQLQMTSTKTTKVLTDDFRTLLKSKSWVFTEDQRQPGVWIFAITKPRCGTLAVVPAQSGSIAAVGFTPCGSPSPLPTGSRSP